MVPALGHMRVPTRRVVRGFKDPASRRDVYIMVCGGIDQIANDRHVSPAQVMEELRCLEARCGYHLAEMLTEAVTGVERPYRGLRIRPTRKLPR